LAFSRGDAVPTKGDRREIVEEGDFAFAKATAGKPGHTDSEDFHLHYVTSFQVKGFSYVNGRDEFHLVLGIIGNAGKNDRPSHQAGDENRITLSAAEGGLLRNDFNALTGLKDFESAKILSFGDLQVERPWIGVKGKLGQKLSFHPGDLGKIHSYPDAFNNFSSDLNGRLLYAKTCLQGEDR
jgi:hypothetical protein